MVVEVPQEVVFGVNVYVVVAVLLIAVGNHEPVIPFVDVLGKAATAAPEQIGPT
jgi:hypothetical protein